MKPYHINKKQILIMGYLGMFPLFSSAQDILSTSGTSRWDYSNSRVERNRVETRWILLSVSSPWQGLEVRKSLTCSPSMSRLTGVTASASNRSAWPAREDIR